jgi:hypothetical protein
VVRHELGEAEGGLEPVRDGVPVPHHARNGLRDAEAEEHEHPDHERRVVVRDDRIDRLADRERHERLGDHPEHAEEDPRDERRHLVPADPEQQPNGRARVRDAGIGDREADHAAARAVVDMREERDGVPRSDPSDARR